MKEIKISLHAHTRAREFVFVLFVIIIGMPSKRRGRAKARPSPLIYLQNSQEKFLQGTDSDIRTIPDQTFGKVYSTQIVPYSPMIEPEILVTSIEKSKKKQIIKRKRISRK